jgi:hypothetical protein
MPARPPITVLRAKSDRILPHLDERSRRLYLAGEAAAIGHGVIALVAAASGISVSTVSRGITELLWPRLSRCRAIRSASRPSGACCTAWAAACRAPSRPPRAPAIRTRDAQFAHLSATATSFLDDGQPVISVDTKAKEWLGNRDRPGRTWRPGKDPIKVDCHTFTTSDHPVAILYGIYDIATNTGWVKLGTDHDTAEFAVESVHRWWQRRGQVHHPNATQLLITADADGSNDPHRWTWKKHLAAFALESGLEITVCHFPPGTQCRCFS